jgi:PKD repeat protein/endonuclease I
MSLMGSRFLRSGSISRGLTRLATVLLSSLWLAGVAGAQIPPGYYDSVDDGNAAALRATLHAVIDDHVRFPYTSSATDTWDILELADQDPNDSGAILDVYLNESYAKQGGGNSFYNREHTWPKSYGFPNDGSTNMPYTDCHMLFLCDDGYNSSRSNKPYRDCTAACSEKVTVVNDGMGGGSGVYPGNSNWTTGSFTQGTWETWIGRRGDVARALLYMDVRYEGGTHGGTGVSEPDLILTDIESLIENSNTGGNESVAYMGMLSVLLQWHVQDPVDAREQARNNTVYAFQGNRNPFIDHPEWVDCLFSGTCGGGDVTPPLPPVGLVAVGGDGQVDLDWTDNTEPDLSGYNVQRSLDGSSFTQVNGALVVGSLYTDSSVSNGTTYWYAVTAVDTSSNESGQSAMVFATPQGGGGGTGTPWINEFHYDNSSSDVGEFVEVAGPAGSSLSGWSVVGYNGNGGGSYKTVTLSGTIPDQQGGFGTLAFAFSSMQNGSPDGLALVDDGGVAVEFLSYEGSFTATDGAANGMTSMDIGVSEPTSSPVGWSLQLAGTGSQASDFTWQAPAAETDGLPNTGQTFSGGAPDTTPPAPPTGLVATAGDGQVSLDWQDNGELDLAGYDVYRSTTSGGSYSQLTGSSLGSSDYLDAAVTNGTTYYYVVTASDQTGNESGNSGEASATPFHPPTPPVADFSGTPTSGEAPVVVSFTDLSTNSPSSWSWDFGDGGSSTLQNPAHSYDNGGTYTVSLTATNADGSDAETKVGYVVVTDPPVGGALWYLSFNNGTSVPGVGTVADEDVVSYDPATDTWEWIFDGSNVGVTQDLNALHVRDDGSLVMSFQAALTVPGLSGGPNGESVDDSDLVLFTPTSTGSSTAGSFSFLMDGSDVSLSSNGEDVDGVHELSNGDIALSTTGGFGVSGASGKDEDVFLFTPSSLGSSTSGSFTMHFDGSDVGFSTSSSEDLGGVSFDGTDLLFTTAGTWSASGGSGSDEDIGRFVGSYGSSTSGSATLELDLSALGIDTSEDVDAVCFVP